MSKAKIIFETFCDRQGGNWLWWLERWTWDVKSQDIIRISEAKPTVKIALSFFWEFGLVGRRKQQRFCTISSLYLRLARLFSLESRDSLFANVNPNHYFPVSTNLDRPEKKEEGKTSYEYFDLDVAGEKQWSNSKRETGVVLFFEST